MSDQDGPSTDTVADLADQLMREFGLIVSLDTVTACVRSAQRDLDGLALGQVPANLLDRLARARLLEALDLHTDTSRHASRNATRSGT